MEAFVRQSLLYDFYGDLLTDHQKEIFEAYVLDDLSLGEIAAETGISRQGVHDIIKRCNLLLSEYEEKLKLVDRFMKVKEKVLKIEGSDDIHEVRTIAKEILELM